MHVRVMRQGANETCRRSPGTQVHVQHVILILQILFEDLLHLQPRIPLLTLTMKYQINVITSHASVALHRFDAPLPIRSAAF